MAEKLSYTGNAALMQGEEMIAASKNNAGANVKAFVEAAAKGINTALENNKKRDEKLDAFMTNLGGVENISMIEEDTNKQAITDFVRNGRDEYALLAKDYDKTKDRATLDKMEAIKFSFVNLNNQLKAFTEEKKQYLADSAAGLLASVETYEDNYYTNAYTNNTMFSVDEKGDIYHSVGENKYKFKTQTGKYNLKSLTSEKYILKEFSAVKQLGTLGGVFSKDDTRNNINVNLKELGVEGIQVMATTDLTGDDSYTLKDNTVAKGFTFKEMYAAGKLKPEVYAAAGAEEDNYDAAWMMDDTQSDKLLAAMSEYYSNVMKDGYDTGKLNYKDPNITSAPKTFTFFNQEIVKPEKGSDDEKEIQLLTNIANKKAHIEVNKLFFVWDKSKESYVFDPNQMELGGEENQEFSQFKLHQMAQNKYGLTVTEKDYYEQINPKSGPNAPLLKEEENNSIREKLLKSISGKESDEKVNVAYPGGQPSGVNYNTISDGESAYEQALKVINSRYPTK